jgi:hypothetical protein
MEKPQDWNSNSRDPMIAIAGCGARAGTSDCHQIVTKTDAKQAIIPIINKLQTIESGAI